MASTSNAKTTGKSTDKRTVAQLRQELRDRGLISKGNKNALIERLQQTNTMNPQQPAEIFPPKRRRTAENEASDGEIEDYSEGEVGMETSAINMRVTQLNEWEQDLQRREETIRLKEGQHDERRGDSNEPPTQPFKLALRTIGLRDIIEILPEFDPDNRSTLDSSSNVLRC